jgi:hypothetical protein
MRGGVGARRSVRLAAVAAAALLAGVLPGTDSAASGGTGELSLSYACVFASGEQDVTVAFAQTYPHVVAVGKPIQPGELTMTVTVPRTGATVLLPPDTATVTGTADLKARVSQGTSAVDVDWPGLSAAATASAGTGDLDVGFTGKVPGVSVTAPGTVAFAVGALTLSLHPQAAPGAPTPSTPPVTAPPTATGSSADTLADAPSIGGTASTGSPSAPPSDATGTCTPKPGQDTRLAAVPVDGGPNAGRPPGGSAAGGPSGTGATGPGGTASTGSSASSSSNSSSGSSSSTSAGSRQGRAGTIVPLDSPPHSGRTTCDPPPIAPLDPKRLPPVSPTAIVLPLPGQPPFPPVSQCAYVTGYSNVKKQNGAMIINNPYDKPAIANINSGQRKVLDYPNQYVEVDSIIALALPPSHATFLTYGFMPTTADVHFTSLGVMTVVQTGDDFFDQPILTTIGGYQDIRISDVRINGTPLDVGPRCHTATPVDVVLKGRKDEQVSTGGDGKPDYDIQDGGPLVDENLTIPPFTGCASHGENLDALFTTAISGSGNTLNLVQGRICDPVNAPDLCQPEIQIPELPRRR